MKILNDSGNFATAKKFIDDENYLGTEYSIIMSIVLDFSKVGPEFYKYMENNIPLEWEEIIKKIVERNKKYAEQELKESQPGE